MNPELLKEFTKSCTWLGSRDETLAISAFKTIDQLPEGERRNRLDTADSMYSLSSNSLTWKERRSYDLWCKLIQPQNLEEDEEVLFEEEDGEDEEYMVLSQGICLYELKWCTT